MDIFGLTFLLIPGSILLAFLVAAVAVYQRFAADKLTHEGYSLASGGDFLRYALVFLGEIASAIFVIQIVFIGIDRALPDPSLYNHIYPGVTDTIRHAISSLVIVFPIMLAIEWWIRSSKTKGAHETLAHKGYVWAGLLVTAFMLVVTTIATLNEYLTGDLTSRFALKALVLAVIALLLGGFRLVHILKPKAKRVFTYAYGIAIVLVVAAIAWGFVMVGSPAKARAIRIDNQRVEDLWNIEQRIFEYWNTRGTLPNPLGVLEDRGKLPTDPVTHLPYKYEIATLKQGAPGGIVVFHLCATFALPSENPDNSAPSFGSTSPIINQGPYEGDAWKHKGGEVCFERTIDPKDFPKPGTPISVPLRATD